MRNPSPVLALTLVVLAGCPLIAGPKEDKPEDDAAEATTSGPDAKPNSSGDGDPGTGESTGTETGSAAAPVCEDQLRECNALLEACVAKMPD